MLKAIVTGSKNFSDYKFLEDIIDEVLFEIYVFSKGFNYVEIVSGTSSKGVDSLSVQYAKSRNYQIKQFPVQWDLYGRRAGILRNNEMAKYLYRNIYEHKGLGICICFWDEKSKGTANMIDTAKQYNIPTYVINYNSLEWDEEEI